jgi:hypothetical protein
LSLRKSGLKESTIEKNDPKVRNLRRATSARIL